MKKVAIIHTLPIDYYPPAVNMINTLADKADISVITTHNAIGSRILYTNKIKTFYGFRERRNGPSILNLILNIWFIFYSFFLLIWLKPDIIIYFESISAASPYFYKRYFNHKVKVCVHYHEYMTLDEYKRPGMRIWNKYRQLEEKWLLSNCHTISQTNSYRLNFFKNDYPFVKNTQCMVLPNYPPRAWKAKLNNRINDRKIRCVYIGSLSLKDMYLKEYLEWINTQAGTVTVDFFSYNYHSEIIEYFNTICSRWITLHSNGVNYFDIPQILKSYDVGILLYKAETLNYKFNETNKLYEYLVGGLSVIYPISMSLINEMSEAYPFKDYLHSFNPTTGEWPDLSSIQNCMDHSLFNCVCEPVYENYWIRISK